jgi:hypothetical protein
VARQNGLHGAISQKTAIVKDNTQQKNMEDFLLKTPLLSDYNSEKKYLI